MPLRQPDNQGPDRIKREWETAKVVPANRSETVELTGAEATALRRDLWGWPLSDRDYAALSRLMDKLGAPPQRPSDRRAED